jgi:short subunit fatty acids transporter
VQVLCILANLAGDLSTGAEATHLKERIFAFIGWEISVVIAACFSKETTR